VLGGGPGTGKTYTTAVLIGELIRRHGQSSVAVAAPTGKAAVRITEALHRSGVAGVLATTIHTMLGIGRNGHDGDGWGFQFGAGNPLPYRFVVVDESSMTDTDLMASLLEAIGANGHLLLVGDTEQLAPVGHGRPLFDLIAAGAPSGMLTEIKRQKDGPGNLIIEACAAIREGRRIELAETWDLPNGRNLVHIEAGSPHQQMTELQRLYAGIRASGKRDAVWDVQTICGLNAGDLGRVGLNRFLQVELNATGEQAGKNPLRVGDKIICLKNGWHAAAPRTAEIPSGWQKGKRVQANSGEEHYIANGDLGAVVACEPTWVTAKFTAPERMIRFPVRPPRSIAEANGLATEEENAGNGSGTNGSGEPAKTSSIPGCTFDLGYAITGHKSQGSEWPIVIILIDGSRGAARVCDKSWIYTAISRASQLCITIGREGVLRQMAKRVGVEQRKTFLRERILENAKQ
jgi:exodeoxyribonuclease V alpha subunit